jgi:C-terminal processing protease CtpA/Prc
MGTDRVQTGLRVSKIVAGGAAAESGVIEIGDRLLSVDGVDVFALPLKELAEHHIRGEKGSSVDLTLSSNVTDTRYDVRLQRK